VKRFGLTKELATDKHGFDGSETTSTRSESG